MIDVAQTEAADSVPWSELRPVIDEAMMELAEADRLAVLLRYFESRTYGEVGAAMNLSEGAARMRVSRALETLRRRLAKCGITSTTAALGASLSTHGATAVSPALVSAILQGAAGASVGGTLLFAMTMSSLKFPAAVALAIAAFTYGVFEHSGRSSAQRENSELKRDLALLENRLASAPATPPVATSPASVPSAAVSTGPKHTPDTTDPADPVTNPEARTLYLADRIANFRADSRSYFESLGLSGEQWDRYAGALRDGFEVELDAQALARAGNLSGKETELVMAESMAKVRRELLAAIGPEANQGWIEYNRRLALRPLAEELAAKLAFSNHPLTPEQGEAIVDIVQQHGGLRLRGANWVLNEDALNSMRGILLPQQHEVMKDQQTVRRAGRDLATLKRSR